MSQYESHLWHCPLIMSYSSTKGANVSGVWGAVASVFTGNITNLTGSAKCMRCMTCPFGVFPLSAQQALVNRCTLSHVMPLLFTLEASLSSQGDWIERAYQALYCLRPSWLIPVVWLSKLPYNSWVDLIVGISLCKSPGRVLHASTCQARHVTCSVLVL